MEEQNQKQEQMMEDYEILVKKIYALISAIHVLRVDLENEKEELAAGCLSVIEDSARTTYEYANGLLGKYQKNKRA